MPKQLRAVGIAGTGSYLPDIVVTNQDLERELETTDEWIRSHTGIVERRHAPLDVQTSDMATEAARRALDAAGLRPDQVDGILVGIGTGDHVSPPTANMVQRKLGCPNAFCLDLRQACAASVTAMIMGSKLIADGGYDTILAIGAEMVSRTKLAPDDRTGRAIFGDGAGAAVLRPTSADRGILATYMAADSSGWDAVGIYGGGSEKPLSPQTLAEHAHCIRMDGRRVWDFVGRAFPDAVRQVVARAGLSLEDVDVVVPHQANLFGIREAMRILDMPMEKAFTNLEKVGNTIEASVPIALDEAVRTGRIKSGDLVVLCAFGAGWNWCSLLARWE